jgi:hypothetical protein
MSMIVIFVLFCCANRDSKVVKPSVVSDHLSVPAKDSTQGENLEEFYIRFNRDKQFQRSRIKYPLNGKFFDGTVRDSGNIDYVWQESDSLDYNVLSLDTTVYKRERLEQSDSSLTEKIFIPNSGFKIEANFKRINGQWFLIYFSYIDS